MSTVLDTVFELIIRLIKLMFFGIFAVIMLPAWGLVIAFHEPWISLIGDAE